MDRKKDHIIRKVLFMITTIALIQTDLVRGSKFDFPKHMIGINYSNMHELEEYLKYKPVDLGIDVLDDEAPKIIREALSNTTLHDDVMLNQYSKDIGIPRLRKAIAQMYSKILATKLKHDENVVVTVGATEAVFSAFHGHTSPGDEWIVIEPAYTMYLPMIKMAFGVPRCTTLKLRKSSGRITGEDWILDRKEMESLFNNRTKGILLNNPLNPLGKVYTYSELQFIASMAKKYNTLVISDEAHEFITFKPHVRLASLPGMFERTITIGSASKTFSLAGWRIGWAVGSPHILNHVKTVHERATDCAPTPQQNAIAFGIEEELKNFGEPDSYFVTHLKEVKEKRDIMVKAFMDAGMQPIIPDGGYCMVAKWTTILGDENLTRGSGMNFVKWLIKNVGILGLPLSGFYIEHNKDLGEEYVRYCFHKKDETIEKAVKNLKKLKRYKYKHNKV